MKRIIIGLLTATVLSSCCLQKFVEDAKKRPIENCDKVCDE